MHELMAFDTSLKNDWNYDGGNRVDGWKGLSWEVLVKKDWFGRWLEVERDCRHFLFLGVSFFRAFIDALQLP